VWLRVLASLLVFYWPAAIDLPPPQSIILKQGITLNRNGLYLIIGALLVAVIGLGIYAYREETKPGIELKIGEGGVSVEQK
jgi:hypothetical protein